MRLKGKTALISGAGRNNGKAIALTFAREGADLILVARTGDELKQVAKECEGLGVQALPLLADVGKHEEVNRVVQRAGAVRQSGRAGERRRHTASQASLGVSATMSGTRYSP